MKKKKILLVGSGAREHAIACAIARSPQQPELLVFASSINPGIKDLASEMHVGDITDQEAVAKWGKDTQADLAIVGPEAPLETAVADALWEVGIPVVGPKQELAQLETSKAFTRDLLTNYGVGGSPKYKCFDSMDGVEPFLQELGELYVIKANGLMGGKGVKVAGDHLHSHSEALEYCQELVDVGAEFVIEEKMIGVEFSLISMCGGKTLMHFPAVQDHKRAYEGDKGPNTGGMGSYSDADHSLPFLSADDVNTAREFNEKVAAALIEKTGQPYKGVLYGGFMATVQGVMIVEYNARFGDPECLNLLTLLESDFVEILEAVVADTLDGIEAACKPFASVCKYAVPEGYPDKPLKGFNFDMSGVQGVSTYLGAVDVKDGKLVGTGSRTIAVVALGSDIKSAETQAESQILELKGPLFHRKDIGTEELLDQRIQTMATIRGN